MLINERVPVGQVAYTLKTYNRNNAATMIQILAGNGCDSVFFPAFTIDPYTGKLFQRTFLTHKQCRTFTMFLNVSSYNIDPLDWPQTNLTLLNVVLVEVVRCLHLLHVLPAPVTIVV